MRVFLLILLVVVTTAIRTTPLVLPKRGAPSPPPRLCPTSTRDDLLQCISVLDSNEDGTLTVSEMDTWFTAHTDCLPTSFDSFFDGSIINTYCDANSSGNLTMTDWNSASSCISQQEQQYILCLFCVKCGLYPLP